MSCGIAAEGIQVMGRKGRPIIRDINLEIAPGSFVGIIGGSGAGKSTLLKALSIQLGKEGDYGDLYLEHAEGRSLVDGNTLDAYLERLGFVPQEDHFIDELSPVETLQNACSFAGVASSEIDKQCREILHSVELPGEIHGNRIRTLSGGQKRRLSIARALASAPDILFLDEPTSGLDLPVAVDIMNLLNGLCRREGATIVCTSHLPSTLKVCDRVLSMSVGKDRDGGHIIADYDAASFRIALNDEEARTRIYHEVVPPQYDPTRENENRTTNVVEMPGWEKEKSKTTHFKTVFGRSWKAWRRDRINVMVFAAQPVMLAIMVVITQSLHKEYAGDFIDFFLTISALWIGMSLCIRDFVSERTLYALDELTGLDRTAYLWAKISFAVSLSIVGVFILCLVAHFAVGIADQTLDLEHAKSQFTIWHFMPRFIILGITGVCGALLGLFLSLITLTERVAISLMPLVLLPQVVFSRFACGFGSALGNGNESPYRSVTYLFDTGLESANILDGINLFVSLPMTARHASWSLHSLTSNGFEWGKFYWLDFITLTLLVVVQVGLVYLAFINTANDALSRIR